jgi:NAD-dependent dihydropyrimidine dehydrogenase PreA subunit
LAGAFAAQAADKLRAGLVQPVQVAGNFPYRTGMAAAPRAPKTRDNCTACRFCVSLCPSGAIAPDNPRRANPSVCISCCACVKACPQEAKYFDDEGLLQRKALAESKFLARREPELFC